MSERRRNPRRVVKDVKRRCYQYGSAIVSTWRSILSCGHEVEGYPDTLDGRRACPECGSEAKRCAWTMDEDGVWHTGCGVSLIYFPGGTPASHGQRICHACGKSIAAAAALAKARGEGASDASDA